MVSYLGVMVIAHDDVKKAKKKISAHHLHLPSIFTFLRTFSSSLIAAAYQPTPFNWQAKVAGICL